jgi:hypothetical protein
MSDTPHLLSPERVKAIQQYAHFPLVEVSAHAAQYLLALTDMLADHTAFRQQVATELAKLMWPEPADNPTELRIARACNETLRCATTRLGLELPTV